MTLGQRLLDYRAKNDLSMAELAEKCKISKQTIFLIEKYDANVTPLTRSKIELVIGAEKKE